ncbi:MAG: hypothetical protein ACTSYU_02545 [Promethearchaeota archaeon]
MSIKPKYVQPILEQSKKFEFRKTVFVKKNIDRIDKIIIYSSSPKKKIVGFFKIDKIIAEKPKVIWKLCKGFAGISEKEFFKYFEGKDLAYAIKIKYVKKFEEEIDPHEISPDFRPPQSYCYLKSDNLILNNIKNQL